MGVWGRSALPRCLPAGYGQVGGGSCSSLTARRSGLVLWRRWTGAPSSRGRAGSPGSWVPTARGRPPPCGRCSGWSSSTPAPCAGGGAHHGCAAGAVRLHAGGAGSLSPDAGARAARVPGPAVRADDRGGGRTVDAWLERLGVADRARDRLDSPVARKPAACPADRRPGQRARAARARRAVLRPGPPRHGRDVRVLAEVAAAGATVLFSSHQLDLVEDICEDVVIIDHGRVVLAGDLADLRAAVPQRFVDHPLPRASSGLVPTSVAVEVVRRQTARRGCGSAATPTWPRSRAARHRRGHLLRLPAPDAVGAVPPGGGGMNGLRQGWLVAVREMRERGRSRAFLASLVLMLLVVAGRHRPARDARHRPRHQGRRPDRCRRQPGCLAPSVTRRRRRDDDPHPPLRHRGRRRGRRPRRRHRRPRGRRPAARVAASQADEQLKAVVTGAIQLVAVHDRAAAAGIDPEELLAIVEPVPVDQRRARPGGGAQPRRRDGRLHHDRRALLRHQHLRRPWS